MNEVATTGKVVKRSVNEKIVYIKRKQTFIEASNHDPEVQGYFDMSYRAIGSYYKSFGKQFGTGLTREELIILMPELLDVFAEDKKEFNWAVKDYFRNKNTKISPEGLKLNIAMEKEDEPLSDTNHPVNIAQYVTYLHAIGHPEVASSIEEADMYQHKRFYVEDTEKTLNDASSISKMEDSARLEYYKIVEDKDKVEQMLILLGYNTKGKNAEKRQLALRNFTTIEQDRTANFNEKKLERFMRIANDKRLKAKYEIEMMIAYDILQRVGTSVLIEETGDEIGGDMEEASLWYSKKENVKTVNSLKARLKEFGK